MEFTTRKGTRLVKFFKKRFVKKSIDSKLLKSKSDLLSHNVKRAIQSTSDLPGSGIGNLLNSSQSSLVPTTSPTPDRNSLDSSVAASSEASSFSHSTASTTASSFFKPTRALFQAKPVSKTRVLFTPPKSSRNYRPKIGFTFYLKRCKSTSELYHFEKSSSKIPMITLTEPEDEETYFLTRPFPFIPTPSNLEVPMRQSQHKSAQRQWPHPTGPWLRPASDQFPLNPVCGTLTTGIRLSDGTLLGWDLDYLESMGVCLPPQLPTEKELENMALVEQVAINLQRAQDALSLYGRLDHCWAVDWDDEYIIESVDSSVSEHGWADPQLERTPIGYHRSLSYAGLE